MEAISKCRDVSMSSKQTREVLAAIRGMETQKAKMLLMRVMNKQQAVPFKRRNRGVGHKPGIAAGRYPFKVSKQVLSVIETAEAAADQKGMIAPYIIFSAIQGEGLHKHRGQASAFFPRSPGESHGRRVNITLILKEKFEKKGEEARKAKKIIKKKAPKKESTPKKEANPKREGKPVKDESKSKEPKKSEPKVPKHEVKK